MNGTSRNFERGCSQPALSAVTTAERIWMAPRSGEPLLRNEQGGSGGGDSSVLTRERTHMAHSHTAGSFLASSLCGGSAENHIFGLPCMCARKNARRVVFCTGWGVLNGVGLALRLCGLG